MKALLKDLQSYNKVFVEEYDQYLEQVVQELKESIKDRENSK